MSVETIEEIEQSPMPRGVALGKSSKQQITGLKIDGIDARVITGKPNTNAVSSKGGKIALDLGAFAQVIELPSNLADKGEIEISFKVKPVPGPQKS